MLLRAALSIGALVLATAPLCALEDRDTKVRKDVKEIGDSGLWIYNDLPKGFETARRTGKPLLIVFR